MKIIVIILLVFILINTSYAQAKLVSKTTLEQYVENELILVGNVASLTEDLTSIQTEYQIDVEKYLKNPRQENTITVIGHGAKSSESHTSVEKIFEKGDRVLLFLNQVEGKYVISLYSVNAQDFDADSDFILPPSKLFKAGILPEDIVCRGELKLVMKATDNSPICIKPTSLERLTELGLIQEIKH